MNGIVLCCTIGNLKMTVLVVTLFTGIKLAYISASLARYSPALMPEIITLLRAEMGFSF